MSEDIKRQKTEFCGYKITVTEVSGQESITFLKLPNDQDWKEKFTYFLEHLITHDEEKINLIVAEVERIAGSKGERTFSLNDMREAFTNCYNTGKVHPGNNRNKDEREYFKQKFSIDLNQGIAGSKKEEIL